MSNLSPAAIVYDSTGVNAAAVLAASTIPVATDKPLVVALSPNSAGQADTTTTGVLAAVNSSVQIVLNGHAGAGFQMAAGTLIGTIVTEVSLDGGVTFVGSFFDDPATGQKSVSIVFAASNAATARSIAGASGATHARVRVSAATSGTANITVKATDTVDPSVMFSGPAATALPPVCVLNGASDGALVQLLRSTAGAPLGTEQGLIVKPVINQRQTYSAGATGLVTVATATDVFTLLGSATKTVRLLRLEITATQTTGGAVNVLLLKRSTANTLGTSTAQVAVPHDSTNAAATAVVTAYTANPTLGAVVGSVLRTDKVFVAAATAQPQVLVWDFSQRAGQEIVLRGVAQLLAVNLNGVTVAGGSFNISAEWVEE